MLGQLILHTMSKIHQIKQNTGLSKKYIKREKKQYNNKLYPVHTFRFHNHN